MEACIAVKMEYGPENNIFILKMMMKSGLEKINLKFAFRVAAAQCKKICPERLNWSGRLAGISEGHRGISIFSP